MTFLQRFTELCDQHGIKPTPLLISLNISAGNLANWRKGVLPNAETQKKLTEYFNVSTDYLLGRDEPNPADYEYPVSRIVRMPIIGIIAAGYNGEVREEHIGDVSLLAESLHGFPPEDCFVLRVSGNSMLPELKNGDLVLIHRQSSVDSGTIAAVMYDDCDATLKKVEYEPNCDWMLLVPLNPEYPTKRFEKYELNSCRILGKLVSLVERHY